ncbi:G-type lectin S-receptor-like serine/threonine-protein kinase At1g11300 [Hevea brasiliensis]|uniref:G-type lectin S-receptor-like serine/threonine-protein kinase At1g11300 n=1 Tax=Hevea brasiliensis TaxID=3981 RepID=UPI0025EBDDEA|nr:G-type lectin S-receptor-like serine/threonine-protein kinase At1g11300 [Hevea brasiliensis]
MESSFLFAFFTAFISLSIFESSKASDSLYPNQSIRHPHTIVSAGGTFSLGFFSPGKTENYYLGIWYTRIPMNKFVWVGNRDYPFHNSATLSISTDGNIMITDGKMSYKVTNISVSGNAFAKLLDSGNLILKGQVQKAGIYWQSFDYPTDTLLPGMNLGDDFRFNPEHFWTLVSWSSIGDPTPGNFSLVADFSGLRSCNLIIKQGNETYWKSPIQGLTYSGQERNSTMTMEQQDHYTGYVSNGFWFSEVIPKNERHRISTFNLSQNITSGKGYVTFSANTKATSRIVLDVSGQLKQQIWSEHDRQWNSLVSSKCGFHSCGPFSFCDESAHTPCTCLKGFRPYSPYAWKEGDTYQGCVRKASLQCNDSRVLEKDGFYHMRNFILPSNQVKLHVNNTEDCRSASLGNCSWIAYALDYDQGCLVWENELFDLKIPLDGDTNGRDFYLKLAASELSTKDTSSRNKIKRNARNKRQLWTIVILGTSLATLTLCLFIHLARTKLMRKGGDLLQFNLEMTIKDDNKECSEENSLRNFSYKEVKLPLFSFRSVAAATQNFSAANKLGEGGFGPVYKGKLLRGGEVAVKRLSRRSGQGWEELKNEALLIAKLQHKNLVRLLGCCIERDEKILIYEYMPNKSLDFFLFDPAKRTMLDWETRVRIIEGVAQGLLYLHQYSRLRIIHRDLKASNILLDKDMNPKISDFGMARIFGGNELEANTKRIVGTYGYMSPEYALEGLFSIKSDVFSFGVLLLEIVSGRKNTGLYQAAALNLLRYTWQLWTSESGLNSMDPALDNDPSTSTPVLLRYVQIALLCVQESATDRPTMSDVVSMLNNESAFLPSPKPPAFSNVRSAMESRSPMRIPETVNNVTITVLEAR